MALGWQLSDIAQITLVFVNHLKKYSDLETLNDFLKAKGFKLNTSGGEIKGTPQVFLEQSSTLANSVKVEFTDSKREIPSCYFEFAKRYPLASGELYQGFVAKSADKIFESTNAPNVSHLPTKQH